MQLVKIIPSPDLLAAFDCHKSRDIEFFTAPPDLFVLKSIDTVKDEGDLLHLSISKQRGDGYPPWKHAYPVARHFFSSGQLEFSRNPGHGDFKPIVEFWGKLANAKPGPFTRTIYVPEKKRR